MQNILTVFRREMASYFATPVAYVFIVIFLSLNGVLTFYVGNLLDRILYGKVTDFVVWKYYDKEWPVFNIADVMLLVGIGLLMIHINRVEKLKQEAEASPSPSSAAAVSVQPTEAGEPSASSAGGE